MLAGRFTLETHFCYYQPGSTTLPDKEMLPVKAAKVFDFD
jgi:hypothetical protein